MGGRVVVDLRLVILVVVNGKLRDYAMVNQWLIVVDLE